MKSTLNSLQHRALRVLADKDGGFSPMTLAWLLDDFDLQRAIDLGFDARALDRFRMALMAKINNG